MNKTLKKVLLNKILLLTGGLAVVFSIPIGGCNNSGNSGDDGMENSAATCADGVDNDGDGDRHRGVKIPSKDDRR